jgi:hypothetical protein
MKNKLIRKMAFLPLSEIMPSFGYAHAQLCGCILYGMVAFYNVDFRYKTFETGRKDRPGAINVKALSHYCV